MRTVLRAALRWLAYTAYVAVVALALLEELLRLGVLETPLYQERQAIRARLSDRPRVVILGDSFSLEGRDSVGTLLRTHFASRGIDAINLAKMGEGPSYYLDRLEKLTNPFMFEVSREHPDFLVQNLLLESHDAADAWTVNEKTLSAIAERTRALGADLVVHVFPADVQVQVSHYAFYQTLGIRTDPRFLTTARPQERLANFCAASNLRCFDLLPALRRANGRELYLEQDTHLNTEGNRVAFEQIRHNLESDSRAEPPHHLTRIQSDAAGESLPGVLEGTAHSRR